MSGYGNADVAYHGILVQHTREIQPDSERQYHQPPQPTLRHKQPPTTKLEVAIPNDGLDNLPLKPWTAQISSSLNKMRTKPKQWFTTDDPTATMDRPSTLARANFCSDGLLIR